MNEKPQMPLASEMYEDLKRANHFKERLIFVLICIILALILALAGTNIYHIYQWSQFDTVVVDSDGSGHANYVQGDNTGGIYNNGEGDSPQAPQR